MPVGKITKTSVEAMTPGLKDDYLWDSQLKGFAVKMTSAGTRIYLVKYEIGGHQRRYTIGRHGSPWTPADARKKAQEVLGQVAAGLDPFAEREIDRRRLRVDEAFERFLNEHVKAKRRPSTLKDYSSNWRRFVQPALGRLHVDKVDRPRVMALHRDMSATPYQANRTLALMSKFFNWCEQQNLRPQGTNPCRHVEKYPETARQNFLSGAQLRSLGGAIDLALENGIISAHAAAALEALILTGARKNEILKLEWRDIDWERETIHIRAPKERRSKYLKLTPALCKVLEKLPRNDANPFVFRGQKALSHLTDLKRPWQRACELAGLKDVRLHDIRHTYASVGAGSGLSLPMIGRMLGHSQAATTQRYAHLAEDPVQQAFVEVADRISAQLRPDA